MTDWVQKQFERIRREQSEADQKGGPGSGHFGHAGRPGKQGGSQPGKGGGEASSPRTRPENEMGMGPGGHGSAFSHGPFDEHPGASGELRQAAHEGMLAAAKRTLALWNKYGLGESEDESEPVYNALKRAVGRGADARGLETLTDAMQSTVDLWRKYGLGDEDAESEPIWNEANRMLSIVKDHYYGTG